MGEHTRNFAVEYNSLSCRRKLCSGGTVQMAKMGFGYGSEWHLLRFLGRHRLFLNERISDEIGCTSVTWLDFNFDSSKLGGGDSELKGLEFIQNKPSLQAAWRRFWPQGTGIHNWDAVAKIEVRGVKEWLSLRRKRILKNFSRTVRRSRKRRDIL